MEKPTLIIPNQPTFHLMNKNALVATFNLFGDIKELNPLPIGFKGIKHWLQTRTRFSCVDSPSELYNSLNLKTDADVINTFNCISMQDTFWVKEEGSTLCWDDVYPFRSKHSEKVAVSSLDGTLINTDEQEHLSPVPATPGSFPHKWEFNGTTPMFVKAGSKYTLGGCNSGREPYSEYYASLIARYLGFKCVNYKIKEHTRKDGKKDIVSVCECYTSEQVGSISAHRLGLNSYEKVIEYSKKISKESYNTCLDMLFLDCLLLNTDRHFGNIEFLINNDTLQVLDIAPIFDNNYSLLPRYMEEYDKFNRDDYSARDGRSFDDLYKLVKQHKDYSEHLNKLKSFNLEESDGVSISKSRLDFLNWFLQEQVKWMHSS